MADLKISQLTVGTPALATDMFPANRSGSNVSLTAADILLYGTSPVSGTTITATTQFLGSTQGSAVTPQFKASSGGTRHLDMYHDASDGVITTDVGNLYLIGGNAVMLQNGVTRVASAYSGVTLGLSVNQLLPIGWSSAAGVDNDAGLSRLSAGVVAIGTGAQGSVAGSISLTNGAFAGTMGIRALSTLTDGADGTNTSGYKFMSFVSNSAEAGNVIRVGTTAAVVFTTTSSREFKTILGDSNRDAASARVMAYRMRNYEWKSQPGVLFDGPIAEETYAVNPDPMLFPAGGKSINMSGFIPDLIMTIQTLETRLALLEAKDK